MTSFYQVDKNLTRTLYTLQAVPLLKCYVCPHSPGASLIGPVRTRREVCPPQRKDRDLLGMRGYLQHCHSSCLSTTLTPIFPCPHMPSQKNLLSLRGHLNSFSTILSPNIILQTNSIEQEEVPMTEGQMPKRKSDLEMQKPPQDLLLCDIGGVPC